MYNTLLGHLSNNKLLVEEQFNLGKSNNWKSNI